jgi:hypothetical protein
MEWVDARAVNRTAAAADGKDAAMHAKSDA